LTRSDVAVRLQARDAKSEAKAGTVMSQARVFISYRRDTDALRSIVLHRLIDSTFDRSGASRVDVFRDTRTRLGVEWPEEVRERLSEADIVLVVIGPQWLGAKDQFERRRIDQTGDWVRREIELALKGTKRVIPIAFECEIPPADALLPPIRKLAKRQGTRVRDAFLDRDLQPVFLAIEEHLGDGPSRTAVAGAVARLPYPDPPLPVPPAPMKTDDIDRAIDEMLAGWNVETSPIPEQPGETRVELHRDFTFRSFREVLQFMTEAGDFIEKMNHHPRWENIYETLHLYLTTWDIGHRISHLDIVLANYLSVLHSKYAPDN